MAKHSHEYPHSSSIQKSTYDDETKKMHITFSSGGTHCFKDCDKEIHDGLMAAQSPGTYFHQHVRRKYESYKVD